MQKDYDEFQAALTTLKATPQDPTAGLVAGKYYCFVKDDWKQGLPLLAQGADPSLAAAAAKELAVPTQGTEQFEVAEIWDDLGEKEEGVRRVRLKLHARSWYQKSLTSLSGLARVKAEKAGAESPRTLSPTSPVVPLPPMRLAAPVARPALRQPGNICSRNRQGDSNRQLQQDPRRRRHAPQVRILDHAGAGGAVARL